mmetsp:Transcript_167119/g.536746  ORF Transcript_167119/g.536746 Transcript_167119/m.536746 type:complete len:239 (-) Transcript_167119:1380-2096(-)
MPGVRFRCFDVGRRLQDASRGGLAARGLLCDGGFPKRSRVSRVSRQLRLRYQGQDVRGCRCRWRHCRELCGDRRNTPGRQRLRFIGPAHSRRAHLQGGCRVAASEPAPRLLPPRLRRPLARRPCALQRLRRRRGRPRAAGGGLPRRQHRLDGIGAGLWHPLHERHLPELRLRRGQRRPCPRVPPGPRRRPHLAPRAALGLDDAGRRGGGGPHEGRGQHLAGGSRIWSPGAGECAPHGR